MTKSGIILTPLFWDCECESDFIHSKEVSWCGICGAHADDQPDSRLAEVLRWIKRESQVEMQVAFFGVLQRPTVGHKKCV